MEDFGYCLWLLPKKSHPWHRIMEAVPAHLTLSSHLGSGQELNDLLMLHYRERITIIVTLVGELHSTVRNGFHALEHSVVPIGPHPEWWPNGAHVSFAYKYDTVFRDDEIRALQARLQEHPIATLTHIQGRICNGHYSTWSELNTNHRKLLDPNDAPQSFNVHDGK